MFRRILPSLCAAGSLGVALLGTSMLAHASDFERRLQDQYRGKVFVLRHFYPDAKLHYDSTGALAGGMPGQWTTDGLVRVKEIRLSGQGVKIKAERLLVVSIGKQGLQFAGKDLLKNNKDSKKAVVEIDARVNTGNLTEDQANAILSRIFLNTQDSFVDTVPDYWKPCIADGLSGRNANCTLSAEMHAVPGMANPSRSSGSSGNEGRSATSSDGVPLHLTRIGGGVKPPRAMYQPEPEFSEFARKMKYQGTTTMQLIVDIDGLPMKIRILTPLGAGLDEKAVQAVETWKFRPAEKDGQPVAVEIAVEVDFHLY